MAEVGNIAVFLAGWNSEYQTRLIDGIQKKQKKQDIRYPFLPVRQAGRYPIPMCMVKI